MVRKFWGCLVVSHTYTSSWISLTKLVSVWLMTKPRQDSFSLNMSYREKNGNIPLGMYIGISLDMIKYDPVY
jgi:hypothetical protein